MERVLECLTRRPARPRGRRAASVWAAATGAAVVLAAAFLLAPPMGTDLAAQVARAEFADRYGAAPIDFGWYGGVNQYGYSLFTARLGALIGMRPLGASPPWLGAAALGWLFTRNRARRPLLAGVLGAVVLVGNLASGRITFAVGLAFGLLALCAVSAERPPRSAPVDARRRLRRPGDGGQPGRRPVHRAGRRGAAAGRPAPWRRARPCRCPVAGARSDHWPRGSSWPWRPPSPSPRSRSLFGNGGTQPYSAESMRINVALAVLVAVVLPRRRRVLRVGALLTVLLLVGAYYVPSPIGSNALRLPLLFALPVLAGYARCPAPWLAGLLAATVWWQSPVMLSDVTRAGAPESAPNVSTPARRRNSTGGSRPGGSRWCRCATTGSPRTCRRPCHWPGAGKRQVDSDRNALFYDGTLSAQTYEQWFRTRRSPTWWSLRTHPPTGGAATRPR